MIDHPSCTQNSPQFKYMSFTYSLVFFTFYGYISNSQSDQLPVGLIAQLHGRALHRFRRGHGFESRSGLNFFQVLMSQLLKWCTTGMINHIFVYCK